NQKIFLHGAEVRRSVPGQWPIPGVALVVGARGESRLRKKTGGRDVQERSRLSESRGSRGKRRTSRQRLLQQRIELRIAEAPPPLAFGRGIARSADAPRRFDFPRDRDVDGGSAVERPDGACSQQRNARCENDGPR